MTFGELWRLTRAYKWVLAGFVVLGVLVMLALTSQKPVLYSATSKGYVKVGNATSAGEESGNLALARDKAEIYVGLVPTVPVAERVVEELDLDLPPSAVASRFTASVDSTGLILIVQATGTSPEEARDLANAVVAAVAEESTAIENVGQPAGQKSVSLVRVVPLELAQLPTEPFTPDYRIAALQGAAGGLALAYALILLRRAVDRKIRSVNDVEDATGGSVIGIIPKVDSLAHSSRGIRGDLGQAAEAFRQLRTNLRFVDVDRPPRRIVITSALAGEGKSTVSANLARLVAHAGESVVLVDADLRRPMLATTFDIDGEIGLTQVLAGDVELADALIDTGMPNLLLLPAGRIPPNPSELLGSQRMDQLVAELARDHLVLLDAPPLLPVTDAGLLTAFCDGALLVQTTGKTQIEQSQHCRRILDQVGGRLLGVVLNKAPVRGVSAVAYGYGYASYGSYGAYKAEQETAEAYATVGTGDDGGKVGRGRRARSAK